MESIVSLAACKGYNIDEVYAAVKSALDALGGLDKIVKPNNRVLLKVNLVGAWNLEKAATTHPSVVEVLCMLIKEIGAVPVIGDSSGGSSYGLTEKALKVCGMEAIAQKTGAEIQNFDKSETIKIRGEAFQRLLNEITIAKCVLDADVIISVPKLKTHSATYISGSIKNMFGIVPGAKKAELHKCFPKLEDFSEALLEVFLAAKPHLAVMDGIIGMEGNGPTAGNPKNVGVIIAGTDCVAVDSVMCEICEIKPDMIPLISKAKAKGIGVGDFSSIKVVGQNLNQLKVCGFKTPISMNMMQAKFVPSWVKNFFNNKLNALIAPKPIIMHRKCKKCGICVKSCPAGVMEFKKSLVDIDYKKCISCFCCHELCPENAFEIKLNWVWKILEK